VRVDQSDDLRTASATLTGHIDLATVDDVAQQLLDALQSYANLVVDLTQVTFIDSSGLALLHRLAIEAQHLDHTFTVRVAENSITHRVIAMTELSRVVPVVLVESTDSA
jgi:anti-sigma B factor antagonist